MLEEHISTDYNGLSIYSAIGCLFLVYFMGQVKEFNFYAISLMF